MKLTSPHFGGRDIIDSDLICDPWEPKVREIRLRLFGSEDPPFPDNLEKAAEWLNEAATIDRKMPSGAPRMRQLMLELRELTGADVVLTRRTIPFPHTAKNEQTKNMETWVNSVPAPFGTDLHQLAGEIND